MAAPTAKMTAALAFGVLPATGMESSFPASSRRLAQTIPFSAKFVNLFRNVKSYVLKP
jgi:hypothetical protein